MIRETAKKMFYEVNPLWREWRIKNNLIPDPQIEFEESVIGLKKAWLLIAEWHLKNKGAKP